MSKLSKIHKKYLGFLLSLHLYWPNETGSTFVFSNAFKVVDEIVACYLAGESTVFINLKRGNRTFFPAIKDLACMSSWHQVIIPLVWGVASVLSRARARAPPRAQHPSHLPVATLGCLLHPFSPYYVWYWFLQWPRPDCCLNSARCNRCKALCVTGRWLGQLHKATSRCRQEGHGFSVRGKVGSGFLSTSTGAHWMSMPQPGLVSICSGLKHRLIIT